MRGGGFEIEEDEGVILLRVDEDVAEILPELVEETQNSSFDYISDDKDMSKSRLRGVETAYLKPVRRYARRIDYGHQNGSEADNTSWVLLDKNFCIDLSFQVDDARQKAYAYSHSGNLLFHAKNNIHLVDAESEVSWPSGKHMGKICIDGCIENARSKFWPLQASLTSHTGCRKKSVITNALRMEVCHMDLRTDALRIEFITPCTAINKALVMIYALKMAYGICKLYLSCIPRVLSKTDSWKPAAMSFICSITDCWVRQACKVSNNITFYEMLNCSGDILLICEKSLELLKITDRHGVPLFVIAGDINNFRIVSDSGDLIGFISNYHLIDAKNRSQMTYRYIEKLHTVHVSSICSRSIVAMVTKGIHTTVAASISTGISVTWKIFILCYIFAQGLSQLKIGQTIVPTVKQYLYTDSLQKVNRVIMSLDNTE